MINSLHYQREAEGWLVTINQTEDGITWETETGIEDPMKPRLKGKHRREPVRIGEVFPDIYDLWKAARDDAEADVARTDTEHATAAAKGTADV